MLKQNEWYFIPHKDLDKRDYLGVLHKVVEVKDNTLYADTESWLITNTRKYEHLGTMTIDAVQLTKYGKKVNPPSKMFQILNSETVNGVKEKSTIEQFIDSEDEYNED